MIYDVIVIGAGIEGSSTGYNLVKKNKTADCENVLLIEQFDAIHTRGSSHGGSRMVFNAYREHFNVQMMDMSYGLWKDIEKESGKELYIENGCIAFGKESIVKFNEEMTNNGVNSQLMSAKEINEKYSKQLKLPDDYKGFFVSKAGMVRASHALVALQDLYVKNGGQLLVCHKVTDIKPGETVTVETDKGTSFQTKRLIVTAGAWTKELMEKTGLSLPLKAWRTEALYWSADNPVDFAKNVFPTFLYINDKQYFEFYGLPINEYPGLLRIAYHSGPEIDSPDMRDENPGSRTSQTVSDFVQKHFIGIKKNVAVMEACMYTVTPDLHPFMDRHPSYPNIVIGTGFSGKGFKFAPIVGKLLSELALQKKPSLDLTPFRIDRFGN